MPEAAQSTVLIAVFAPHTVTRSMSTILKMPTTVEQQATDALTGLIVSSPMKRQRVADGTAPAGYSPELSKALKSVVKIFTTVAK